MRLSSVTPFRRICIAATILLLSIVAWASIERTTCRAAFAKFRSIERTSTREEIHKLLGNSHQVFTGTDVSKTLYWGSDAPLGANEGQVVYEERYAHDSLWGGYLIVIGYGPDGVVRSKFIYG